MAEKTENGDQAVDWPVYSIALIIMILQSSIEIK